MKVEEEGPVYQFIVLLHLIGSLWMGFYLILPFVATRIAGASSGARAGYAGSMMLANRWGQFMLIVQFLTGGYLVGIAKFGMLWVSVVILLLILMGATTGIMAKPLKRLQQENQSKDGVQEQIKKVQLFSWLTFALFIVMVVLMKYPNLL